MRGRRKLVTAQQTDHSLAMRRAAADAGLDATGARLIHHYSNAIYLLPAQNAVARITYGHDAAEQVARSQAVTRWLAQEHHFPATQPLDDTRPVTVDTAVVSFWTYYPQPENAPPLTSAQLAILLRLLHHLRRIRIGRNLPRRSRLRIWSRRGRQSILPFRQLTHSLLHLRLEIIVHVLQVGYLQPRHRARMAAGVL